MKKRILRLLSISVQRALAIVVLGGLMVAAVLYLRGYYDFSFIDRVSLILETEAADTEETAGVEDPVIDPSDTEDDPPISDPPAKDTDTPDTDAPQTQPEEPKSDAQLVSAEIPKAKVLLSEGYHKQADEFFTVGQTVLANLSIPGLGDSFSYSTHQVRTTSVAEYERGCVVTEESMQTADRPAVIIRNGYIIRDLRGKLSVLTESGETFLSDYDENTFVLTEYNNAEGKPLFAFIEHTEQEVHLPIYVKQNNSGRPIFSGTYEEEATLMEVETRTYCTLSSDGKWVPDTFNPEKPAPQLDKGLSFDAPAYYGESDCDIIRYYEYGKWGYKNSQTGAILVYPRFTRAFNFNDGYAIAFDYAYMYFINESGQFVFQCSYVDPLTFDTYTEVTLPDTNGTEALGTYYFSHGLTRIRIRECLNTYQKYYYIKSADYSTLYDVNGKTFPIPVGYELAAYHDGVLLLKNTATGLFGQMNYKGEWVVQPEFISVSPYLSGLCVTKNANGKMGLVDTEGNWVLPQVYDYISEPSSGMIAVYEVSLGWEIYGLYTK